MSEVWACPYCVGNSQGESDSKTTVILGTFILAVYIPYFIIFRLIKKNDALRDNEDIKTLKKSKKFFL